MALILLLAFQRSGTGALGTILDQSTDLAYLDEVFHPDNVTKYSYIRFLLREAAISAEAIHPNRCLNLFEDYISHCHREAGKRDVIIDVKYNSSHLLNGPWYAPGDIPGLIHYAVTRSIKMVRVVRRNYAQMYVSAKLAQANNVWHTANPGELGISSIRVDVNQLIDIIHYHERVDEFFNRFLSNQEQVLTLQYEEIFLDDATLSPSTCEQLTSFLDIPKHQIVQARSLWRKQSPGGFGRTVINFNDFRNAMVQGGYAGMLD